MTPENEPLTSLLLVLVSDREHIESDESFVIQERWP
jgi:hypothetical protein